MGIYVKLYTVYFLDSLQAFFSFMLQNKGVRAASPEEKQGQYLEADSQ